MAGQHVRIETDNGLLTFHCPVCGVTIFGEEGYPGEDCPHQLLFIDWVGEPHAGGSDAAQRLLRVWEEEDSWFDEAVSALGDAASDNTVLFDIVERPRGSNAGSTALAIIDFDVDVET